MDRIAGSICCLLCLVGNAQAQDSAVYHDEIELRRQKLFPKKGSPAWRQKEKEEKKRFLESLPRRYPDPFEFWEKRDKTVRQTISFTADVIGTRRNFKYLSAGDKTRYGNLQDLSDFALGLSLPPAPPPATNTSIIWTQPPGVNTTPFYGPLLQILQAGPGLNGVGQLGNLITVAHLQQITPQLLAVGQLFQQNPTLTFSQLLATPQGSVALQAVQSILQPLGMWNLTTLQAWAYYIGSIQYQTTSTLTTLYNQLIQAQIPLPPTSQTITTQTPIAPVNPIEVIQNIKDIVKRGNAEEMAAKLPSLIHSITAHEGFSVPQIYIYGSRSGRTKGLWPYKIGISTERRINNKREVHVLTEDGGYFVNDFASGTSRYWAGPDDASMVYIPIEIKNGRVTSLDVLASNSHVWHKRAAGGDTKLLNRASTPSTSLLKFDVAFLEKKNLHLSIVGGSIPTASLGGVMGEFEIGEKEDIFDFHVGVGLTHKEYYFESSSDLIGYVDLEARLRTPYLGITNKQTQRGLRTWASATASASGMAHLPTTKPYRKGERVSSKWGLQGEARFIPEIHAQLVTPYALFEVSGGITTAVVPGGDVNLEHPERTLSLYPIRSHIEAKVRIRLAKIINEWDQPASDIVREQENLFLEFGFVAESSKAVNKARFGSRFQWNQMAVDFLVETERWRDTSFTDVRLGGGVSYQGFFLTGLQSIKEDDYRLEIGIDIASMFWSDEYKQKGLLESNW
jgi:hypothetical protein